MNGGKSSIATLKAALADGSVTYDALTAAMHEPWKAYIRQLLAAGRLAEQELQKRAATCAWEGAVVQVHASTHAQHAGICGLVVSKSAKLLHIVTSSNRLICVHLPGASVCMQLPPGSASSDGMQTLHRTADGKVMVT